VGHSIDLTEIQNVVGKYATQTNFLLAAGPVTAAAIAKLIVGRNKLVNFAVVGGGIWFAVQEFSPPLLKLMQDQFGYLQYLFSTFGS
jgi:hypothetical protein